MNSLSSSTVVAGVSLREDLHIHSTFSDGQPLVDEIHQHAQVLGLDAIGFVDHVRRGTRWVADFAAAVNHLRDWSAMRVHAGVEAKLLDADGTLDIPENVACVDYVMVADHQLPFRDRCLTPAQAKDLLAEGEVTPTRLIDGLIRATRNATHGPMPMIIAHLFSILPKVGISEEGVTIEQIEFLAEALVATDTRVEVSERWRCPSARVVRILREAGVVIVASTDSHRLETIGRYPWVRQTLAAAVAPDARHLCPTPRPTLWARPPGSFAAFRVGG